MNAAPHGPCLHHCDQKTPSDWSWRSHRIEHFTIDLEGVESLVTPHSGWIQTGRRSVVEVAVENTGIIDGDRLFLSGGSVHPFLDEGLGDGGDILNPVSQMAVSIPWARRSPVTPDPAAAASRRNPSRPEAVLH